MNWKDVDAKDIAVFEFDPTKKYIIFADPVRVDFDNLSLIDIDGIVVPAVCAPGASVRDAVMVAEINDVVDVLVEPV